MKIPAWVWVIIVLLIVAGGWLWFSTTQSAGLGATPTTSQQTTETSQSSSSTSSVSDNLTLGVSSNATLGQYLIAENGMTLYTYAKDQTGTSTCYGKCAQAWPPYIIPAGTQLNLEMQVTGTAGTIVRADGTTQVTYDGKPLYFYAGDTTSGDTNGQGVGGVWYVVKP